MGWLTNLKIRSKLFLALTPLVVMIVLGSRYSSIGSKKIDTMYSVLIDKDVKALHNMTEARGQVSRYGELLYEDIAEPDPDKMQIIEAHLDEVYNDYHGLVGEVLRQ